MRAAAALLAVLALAACGPAPAAPVEDDLRQIESTLDAIESELAGD